MTTQAESVERRVVFFTGTPASASTVETIEAAAAALPAWRFLVVQAPSRPRGSWLRRKLRRWRREPLSYPLEVVSELLARLRARRRRAPSPVRLPGLDTLGLPNVLHRAFDDIHAPEALAAVREFRPWLGVSVGAPILREQLFGIPAAGTVNIHKSLLPDYRGMPPAFWELHDGVAQTGVSIHWMAAGLDTGDVILQRAVPIPTFASLMGVRLRQDAAAAELLVEALRRLDAGDAPAAPQGQASTPTRSRPPWLLARRVRRRLARRRAREARGRAGLRRAAKAVALWAYVRLWAPLRNLLHGLAGRCHATVLLYHRVSDEFLDSVTVGVEQFDRQLALLGRRYEVLDLPAFLASAGRARRRPVVVLTFDDGYEDNFLAARLLRRHGLPCTFFICTRIVGTDRAFPHDLKRLGRAVPALSWPQVRLMRDWGFRFGIHTASHANVASLPLADSLAEIRDAMDDLRREVGPAGGEQWFAFPYGRPRDISDDVRRALRETGVTVCLSACGGVNAPRFDPLDVRRQGIDCRFSDLAFLAAVEGWQVRDRP